MNPRNRPVPPIHLDERWNCLERKDAHQSAPDGASLPQRVPAILILASSGIQGCQLTPTWLRWVSP